VATEYQLRSYQVKPGMFEGFLVKFAQVAEARRVHGFSIEGAWVSDDSSRFVWVVSYDGEDGFEEAEKRYYESDERKAIGLDPGEFLSSVETTMMQAVDV